MTSDPSDSKDSNKGGLLDDEAARYLSDAFRDMLPKEKISAFFSFTFTLALIVVGFLQYMVLNRQAAIADNGLRPWMKLEALSVDSAVVTPDDFTVGLSFHARNVGHSPAMEPNLFAKIIPVPLGSFEEVEDSLHAGLNMCRDGEGSPTKGGALFPEEEYPYVKQKLTIPISEALKHSRTVPIPIIASSITFWIVGCLSYKMNAISDLHHTTFLWVLSGPENTAIDLSRPAPLDVSYLKLVRGVGGESVD